MVSSYKEGLQNTIDPKFTHSADVRFAIFDLISNSVVVAGIGGSWLGLYDVVPPDREGQPKTIGSLGHSQ